MNAVLYILNDYNIKVREGAPRGIQTYMKAYNAKIIPIFLTIASTLLGFIPFLIGDINPFWKSLAIGTMSGLTFSLPVLIIYLPMTFRSPVASHKLTGCKLQVKKKWWFVRRNLKSKI